MQKIKKVSALIMILIMVVSLCACSTLETSAQRLSLRLKGDGSRTLRLSVFTELPEGCTFNIIQQETSENTYPLTVTEKNSKAQGTLKYYIKANSETPAGTYNLTLQYVQPDGNLYAHISMILGVSEKGKFTVHNIEAVGKEEYIPVIGGDSEYTEYTEEENNQYVVRNEDGNCKDLKLPVTKGVWEIDETSYDHEVLLVEEREFEEEGFAMFRVTGLKVGVSDLILFNEEDKVQLKLSFAMVSELKDDNVVVNYLKITDSKKLEYDRTQTEEFIEDHATASSMIRKILPDAYIPSGLNFDQCFVYNFGAVDRGVEFDEYKAAVEAYNNAPENEKEAVQKAVEDLISKCDSADIVFEINDKMFGMTITKARTADELFKFVTKEVKYSEAKEMTVGEKTVKYFIADEGFGGAVFEDANCRYGVIGMAEFTDESFVSCISQLLSLPNE